MQPDSDKRRAEDKIKKTTEAKINEILNYFKYQKKIKRLTRILQRAPQCLSESFAINSAKTTYLREIKETYERLKLDPTLSKTKIDQEILQIESYITHLENKAKPIAYQQAHEGIRSLRRSSRTYPKNGTIIFGQITDKPENDAHASSPSLT